MPVRELIHRSSPYVGFVADNSLIDTQGWGSDHPVFRKVINRLTPKTIVEVGSWKGSSAINMATLCADIDLNTEIICVDTWLGSPGIYTRPDDEWYQSLKHINGYPSLYYTFLNNVVAKGLTEMITPLPLPSLLAAEVLTDFKVTADIVYIDAAHDFKSAYDDLVAFWPLVKEGGVIIGDDFIHWPGVTQAAKAFSADKERSLFGAPGKFIIGRDSTSDWSDVLPIVEHPHFLSVTAVGAAL